MTRNKAIFIILILLAANAIAALWKFGGLGQSDLPESDTTVIESSAPESDEVVDAEPAKIVPDEFKDISEKVFFRTSDACETDEGDLQYLYCSNSAKLHWPVAINGNQNLTSLHKALNKSLFNENTDNVRLAIENSVNQPQFPDDKNHPFEVVSTLPDDMQFFQLHSEEHYLTTYLTSDRFIEFRINNYIDSGSGTGAGISENTIFLVYDKQRGKVLVLNDIISDRSAVLRLINQSIDQKNAHNDANYLQASRVPGVCVEPDKLRFIFPKYEIGCGADGEVSISLSYNALKECLTPYFIELMSNNSNIKLINGK